MMVNFAFCCDQDSELEYMKSEVERCFQLRGVSIAVKCYHNAYELERCISCNCPDILFYDMEDQNGLMREAALSAKRENKNLISIVTKSSGYEASMEDVLLEPLYIIPDRSRKHLWEYAALAYETFLDDENSFSYYVRPDYIHVPIEEIKYFASEGRRTHIVCSSFRDTFYQKLDIIEKIISQKNSHFLRIHKSYFVNTKYISSYNRDTVKLTTGEQLRISRYEYYRVLNERFRQKLPRLQY